MGNIFIYSITEWTSCSLRKITSPEHCSKLQIWQGPPNVNKQYETGTVNEDLSLLNKSSLPKLHFV